MKYGFYFTFNSQYFTDISVIRGYRGHDCMVVGFTTTYAIVVNSNPGQVSRNFTVINLGNVRAVFTKMARTASTCINPNLYAVSKINTLEIQKNQSNRTKVVWLQMINFLYIECDSSYMYCKEFYTFVSGKKTFKKETTDL
jgi:hypothetical protein